MCVCVCVCERERDRERDRDLNDSQLIDSVHRNQNEIFAAKYQTETKYLLRNLQLRRIKITFTRKTDRQNTN